MAAEVPLRRLERLGGAGEGDGLRRLAAGPQDRVIAREVDEALRGVVDGVALDEAVERRRPLAEDEARRLRGVPLAGGGADVAQRELVLGLGEDALVAQVLAAS